ncbi:cation:proton antiporter [Nocardioides marinus]|uniref:CPA2 family monovalent cation:H+ antiporter-2 n=1 Tax=Nocardioides marinus TaxID=374514 RepID=A0A7Z0C2Q1_9ACTN|nr:CPA2 family monovalent cation:H+ antiporter-2 [Nocardioides marinus]
MNADLVVLASSEGVPRYLTATAALVLAAAVVGYLSVRVRVLPIVGFLLAGVLIGPAQLGLVSSTEAVDAAAEIGVILLLFTIGIEFSLERLARVWRWVAFGGGSQVVLATGAGLAVTVALGRDWKVGLFTGFLLALSSTAIVLKLLADTGGTSSTRGQLALATLVFQDLAVVAMVLVVPLLGTEAEGGTGALLEALGIAVAVVGVVLVVARRVMPKVLERVAALCSPEVFLLAVVAICFGTAYLTALAGVSVSLGAFLAGLVVSESRHSTHALSEILPLQVLFSAIFFVSVGMLLDVGFLLANLPLVLAVAVVVLAVKTLTTAAALAPLRVGWRQAVAAGLLLGQVGEFSFVLLTVGEGAGLSPLGEGEDGSQVFVATTVLLMMLTPAFGSLGTRLLPRAGATAGSSAGQEATPAEAHEVQGHVLMLGWGADSVALGADLRARGVPVVMTTLNPGGAAEAEAAGLTVVRGDAMRAHVLEEAGLARARLVVVAEHDAEEAARVAVMVRGQSDVPVVVRATGVDLEDLAAAGVDHVVDPAVAGRRHLAEVVGARVVEVPTADVDVSRLVHYRWPSDACPHGAASVPVQPGTAGCEECLRDGERWVHLRMCLSCGHVGCCDSSPGRHATAHHRATDHPLMASLEPGETWAYCFLDDTTVPEPRG